MKRFLFKILVFALLLFFVLFMTKRTVPFYWANPLFAHKVQHVLEDTTLYNCFFFGSSHTYRHINPVLFDSITGQDSYNMGTPAMFYLETHHALEHFLQTYPAKQKTTIFLQELVAQPVRRKNLHTARAKYYMDWKRLKISVNYFRKQKAYRQIAYRLISFVENQCAIDELRDIAKFHIVRKEALDNPIKKQRGFFPLDQQTALKHAPELLKRQERYKADTLHQRQIQEAAGERSMTLRKIAPEELNISIADKPIEFYQIIPDIKLDPHAYFDKKHFNSEGAEIFTQKLAEEWLGLMMNDE